jgi:hypothetical protein
MNTSPNWTVDEVLEWLGDRFSDQDAALRAIEQAAEGGSAERGSVVATARDEEGGGRRVEIDRDEWIDNRLRFSEPHGYWLLVPLSWRDATQELPPVYGEAAWLPGGNALYPGAITTADMEYDERLGEVLRPTPARWHDVRFRADGVRKAWDKIGNLSVSMERRILEQLADEYARNPLLTNEQAIAFCVQRGMKPTPAKAILGTAREQAGLPRKGRGGRKPSYAGKLVTGLGKGGGVSVTVSADHASIEGLIRHGRE